MVQVNISEQIGLLHNPLEFIVVDFTIAIAICLVNHFLKLFIGQSLPQFFGHSLEVLESYLPSVIIIKEFECFINLLYWITVENLVGHHVQKFWEIDCSSSVNLSP